jgi:subtilisin-like proprotein convertase family protein
MLINLYLEPFKLKFLFLNFKTYILRFIFNICLYFLIAFVVFTPLAYGQTCSTPFNIKFNSRTTTTVNITWSDVNVNPTGWEIEVIIKGQVRTGLPNRPLLLQKSISLSNLLPSTSYELYIRTVCTTGKYSNWNVAIPFTTVLEIPTACRINIPLKDNGTEILLLDVPEKGILGKDIFFQSIDLIIEHDWPADMSITLESPQGQQVLLSGYNGTVTDDFGDINDAGCQRVTTFSADACIGLKSSKPPYIGNFKPDGDMTGWKPDTLSKGYWKIIINDRAIKDIGVLRYVNLKFNKEKCLVPQNFNISQTGLNNIEVIWDYESPCNTVKFYIFENGRPTDTLFVQCNEGRFSFDGLLPNTPYEFVITSICSTSDFSQESCKLKASTTCESVSVVENFDQQTRCKEGCASQCNLKGPIWFNVNDDSDQDWIVWNGKTDTENTGPSGDINTTGQYIYIENNPQLCGNNNEIILQSVCMQIKSNLSGCDMSFYYHSYGDDIKYLYLEVSLDDGQSWEELFKTTGNQGDFWKRATISLSQYQGKNGYFRFRTSSGNGPLSDIALDQIEFYTSSPLPGLDVYYTDNDGDGYGNELNKIEICNSKEPNGYVKQSGDCNDDNPNIHPGVIEIQCNNTDENCNGLDDDQPQFNPIFFNAVLSHTSCNGANDGKIAFTVTGGTAPYQIEWNNGMSGENIENLREGVYFAIITDAGGCIIRSDYYQINAINNLNVIVTDITQPSCRGKTDGSIMIGHNTDNPPYQYLWSNGDTTKNLVNISEGKYAVTVTDINNCKAELIETNLLSKPSLLVGIKTVRHPFCEGQNNGQIELFTTSGVSPYNYLWSNGQTTALINNLVAGIYTSTVTDSNGCINEFSVNISAPLPIDVKVVSTESARCFGESNGAIKTEVAGGKSPYTYLWNNDSERTDDIFNLKAGNYILTVTDANGFKKITPPISISQPPIFEIKVDSIQPASCILGQNGFISLLATGGNGDYNFVWSHTNESKSQFSALSSGNYNVTAYDKLGCKSGIPNIFLPFVNVPVGTDIELIKNNLCYKDTIAQIKVRLTGGDAPFDYNWSQGIQYFTTKSIDTIKNLGAGNYKLTITDVNGCTGESQSITIQENIAYNYAVTQIFNNKCQNDLAGSITLMVNGGTKPIGVNWNGGLYAGTLISNLPNGLYAAQIIDANDCKILVSPIEISSESNIQLNYTIDHDINNTSSGKICLLPTGGLFPYTIKWSNGSINQLCIENLKAGMYSVTVTDTNECSMVANFVISNTSNVSGSENIKVAVFPNPIGNAVHISSNIIFDVFSIYGLNGKIFIQHKNIKTSEIVEDTSNLPSGIYILELKNADYTVLRKLVKH